MEKAYFRKRDEGEMAWQMTCLGSFKGLFVDQKLKDYMEKMRARLDFNSGFLLTPIVSVPFLRHFVNYLRTGMLPTLIKHI